MGWVFAGTISEGKVMITRINNYHNLFFNPIGTSLMVEYDDAPGVLASITTILARHHINILDIRAPQSQDKVTTLAILMLDSSVDGKTRVCCLLSRSLPSGCTLLFESPCPLTKFPSARLLDPCLFWFVLKPTIELACDNSPLMLVLQNQIKTALDAVRVCALNVD